MSTKTALVTLRRRLLGLLFVVVMVAFVALSVAMYNKSFSTFTTVMLKTNEVGNQMDERADVKVRGLIVGHVGKISPSAQGATLTLQLDPEKVDLIPENVSAQFLPKTLFGERYVSLNIPDSPANARLDEGDVIPQDRSSSAVELEQAFNHLLPVLRAVQPQKLSSTLTAIATALEGRGKPLGETLSEIGQYVGELNPHVDQLTHDLRALADASNTLDAATPDFVRALSNLTVTSKTIADQRNNLRGLYSTLTTSSVDLRTFLEKNKENLIRLSDTSRPTLELLAKYSPGTPCFLRGMAEAAKKLDKAFGEGTNHPGLHAEIELVTDRGKYEPGKDEPRYNDHRGPRCYDFREYPDPFPQQPPDGPLKDGSSKPPAAETGGYGLLPPAQGGNSSGSEGTTNTSSAAPESVPSLANSPAEQRMLSALLAPQLGVRATEVPDWSSLLVGPLYRGAEVRVE